MEQIILNLTTLQETIIAIVILVWVPIGAYIGTKWAREDSKSQKTEKRKSEL